MHALCTLKKQVQGLQLATSVYKKLHIYKTINSDILTQAKTKEVHSPPGGDRLIFGRASMLTKEKLSTNFFSNK